MDSRSYNNTKMMKAASANDLYHSLPQTQKYKDSAWEKDKFNDVYLHSPGPSTSRRVNLLNEYCPTWVHDRFFNQRETFNTLLLENELIKHELSKAPFKEKSQFEKLLQLKKDIQKKVELDQRIEYLKIEDMEKKRKNEDRIMEELLQRQKDELALLKTAIREDQEVKMAQKHNSYVTMIK